MESRQAQWGLQETITKIVLAAAYKVCRGFPPAVIEVVACTLAEGITDLVVEQGNTAHKPAPIVMSNFTTFVLWNRILDEVALSIPCVDSLEVIGISVTRTQRKSFIEKFGTKGDM